MAKILLDYVFPISVVPTVPAASTAFLKQACLVAKPKSGQEGNVGNIYECTSMADVATRTDNTDAVQLFAAGMSKVFVLLASDLDLWGALTDSSSEFWTLLISDDFDDGDLTPTVATLVVGDITFNAKYAGAGGNGVHIVLLDDVDDAGSETVSVSGKVITVHMKDGASTADQIKAAVMASTPAMLLLREPVIATDEGGGAQADAADAALATGAGFSVGAFEGVVGFSSSDDAVARAFGANENRCGFFQDDDNGAISMFYAFGKLLSNLANWSNQQYVSMPVDDGVDTLGQANTLFDEKVSFVLQDTEFGNRLALFAAGGKAIAAPYIGKNLRVDLQSRTLSWIAANQPSYTLKNAALLEQRLQDDIIQLRYIDTGWITAGVISIKLLQDNFVASGFIDIAEPKALWKVVGEMSSTL